MDKVAVLLGIYKNPKFLFTSIKALKDQTYKAIDIYVYDNSEEAHTLDKIQKEFPDVTVYKSKKNNGFAGGNNMILRELLKQDTYKYIAVLNDDTKPANDWMENLVKAIDKDLKIGAVTSKLIYFEPFVHIKGKIKGQKNINLLYEKTGFTSTTYPKRFLREGFSDTKKLVSDWTASTNGYFSFDVPIGEKEQPTYELELVVKLDSGKAKLLIQIGKFNKELEISENTSAYKIKVPASEIQKNKFNIIQNASSVLSPRFEGSDLGNGEVDRGQYDKPKDAEMFCGAAVLFRAETLKQVGLFDEYLFMYYEDSDLNFRIKHKGWRVTYEPKALVRHYHTFSSVEWSPLFYYFTNRNIVVFVLKNFGLKAIYLRVRRLIGETVRMTIWMIRTGFTKKTETIMLWSLIKIMFDLAIHLPIILLKRFGVIQSK